MVKKHYTFNGSILCFNTIIRADWYGETFAVSPKKALSNLTYQCKQEFGYASTYNFRLDGILKEV